MKIKAQSKSRRKKRRHLPHAPAVDVIPAPTIYWHPSVSLEKLIADFAAYQDSIIVS